MVTYPTPLMNLIIRKNQKTCDVLDINPPMPFTVREPISTVRRPTLSARDPQKYPPIIIPEGQNIDCYTKLEL